MKSIHRRFLVAAALAATLAAQDAGSPQRFLPKDCVAVARIAGPGAWSSAFAKTQIKKLLQGPTLNPYLGQLAGGFDAMIESMRRKGDVDADLIEGLLTEWAGELTLGLWIDWHSVPTAIENQEMPKFGVVLAFGGDGKFDMKGLVETVTEATERRGRLTDSVVGNHTLRVQTTPAGFAQSMPVMIDGAAIMLIASDIDEFASKVLGGGEPSALTGRIGAGSFGLAIDCAGAISSLQPILEEQLGGQAPPGMIAAMMSSFGLGCLGEVALTIGADDKHVAVDFDLGLAGPASGLMKMMLVPGTGLPKLASWRPAATPTFAAMRLDAMALYDTIVSVWDGMSDMLPMSRADGEAAFAEATKIRLKEDLFEQFGGEVLMVQDAEAQDAAIADDPEDPAAAFGGICIALSLRDGRQFDANIEKLVRSRGLHSGRKSEDYQGVKVHKLNVAGLFAFEYAITEDAVVLALDEDAARGLLRGVLDERAARLAGKPAPELPAAIAERLAAMPPGWNSIQSQAFMSSVGTSAVTPILQNLADQGAIDEHVVELVQSILRGITAELRQLGIEHTVNTSVTTATGLHSRTRW
ncbi:MAG: hypothetical protein IPK26_22990 [Planctomycetes bacterium]|nr:hypothetical protein [Planctomycetota bacterium]